MLKDRIKQLFGGYDEATRAVIFGVLDIEQEHISMQRPRVRDEIDYVIDLVAKRATNRPDSQESAER